MNRPDIFAAANLLRDAERALMIAWANPTGVYPNSHWIQTAIKSIGKASHLLGGDMESSAWPPLNER